jgi:hypothetical protein
LRTAGAVAATVVTMFRSRHRLALAGAALLLAGVVLSTHVDLATGMGSATAGRSDEVVLDAAAVATVPVVGRARGWADADLTSGDHTAKTSPLALSAGLALLLVAGGVWWLWRPDRRVSSSLRTALVAASRAPPVLL